MSLFDNLMTGNSKNQKSDAKKTSKDAHAHDLVDIDSFRQEFSEEFPVEELKNTKGSDPAKETLKGSEKSRDTFKEEYSEGLMSDVSRFGIQSYSKAGVTFEKLSETQGKVNYSGLLAKSGANEVMGVYGSGSNQKWENISMLSLSKEGEGSFMAVIPVEQGKNINLAFKDSAENWDNNSGMNYTFVN